MELFKLPLRPTTAIVASQLKIMRRYWNVPNYTIMCGRQKIYAVQIAYRRTNEPARRQQRERVPR
ncbi:transposase [Paracoccus marcusii]|uniref:transposase n=1 Tax=Paracoccus marcusii TaxID=59779 RepID=UPI003CD0D97F